eukprot:scaffold69983_cov39-Phaeocystis_antarctica.AAC.1
MASVAAAATRRVTDPTASPLSSASSSGSCAVRGRPRARAWRSSLTSQPRRLRSYRSWSRFLRACQ